LHREVRRDSLNHGSGNHGPGAGKLTPRPSIDHIRRPQILAAAAEVIAERGAAATRIADVAERAEVSPPAVLYWFDSKEQLLAEALLADDEAFYRGIRELLQDAARPSDRLALLIAATASASRDFALWLELLNLSQRDAELAAARERLDARWREEVATIVRDGRAAGEFGGVDPERAALVISALLDGLTIQAALEDPAMPPERMVEVASGAAERLLDCELPRRPLPPPERLRARIGEEEAALSR
jgi:AcrR family transcriptional regulator